MKKTLALILFVFAAVFYCVLLLGAVLDVLMSDAVIERLFIISLIVSVPQYYVGIKYRHIVNRSYQEAGRIRRKWGSALAFMMAVSWKSIVVVAKGAPSLRHYVVSSPSEKIVTISTKSSRFGRSSRRNRCRGRVRVAEYSRYFLYNNICIQDRLLWLSLNPGDQIKLIGRESFIGFSYSDYKNLK